MAAAAGERIVRVPGDKSITHRALLFSAFASGPTRVRNALLAGDTQSTAQCLRELGVSVPGLARGEIVLHSMGLDGLHAAAGALDCGNSGTSARLLLGVLAGRPFRSVLTGDASLRSRPMRRVTSPLAAAGARIEELGEPDRLPMAVLGGGLHTIEHDAPRASAQVKSALLLAGVSGGVAVRVSEPHLSRDHTERMLAAMGARLRVVAQAGRPGVQLEPGATLRPLDITVPGDFSSAAFFLAHALLGGGRIRIEGVGVNATRTGLLAVLQRMGGHVVIEAAREAGGEPVADIVSSPAILRSTQVGEAEVVRMIDEIPVLAVLAARAEGETRITGAEELRVKESDRIRALVENLRAVGVQAEELPDGLVVCGTDAPLRGRVQCHGDHRIAMAFGVLAAQRGNDIAVDDPAAASVSFPEFWAQLRATVPGTRV